LRSVCVFCASSPLANAARLQIAAETGELLARAGLRLVYGGGSLGLMGACARAARGAGGRVLGVMPRFLMEAEPPLAGIETVTVGSMHERKMRMFEESDAFTVLPGAIGTLEEVIEVISWRRLGLHDKPIVFLDPDGCWKPLFELFAVFARERLTPQDFGRCWTVVDNLTDLLPALSQASPPGSEATVELLS